MSKSFPIGSIVIFSGSEPCTPKIVHHFFTDNMGNWKFGNFIGSWCLVHSAKLLKLTWKRVISCLLSSFNNYLLHNHNITMHSTAERTKFTTYFPGLSVNNALLLGLLRLGVNAINNLFDNKARHGICVNLGYLQKIVHCGVNNFQIFLNLLKMQYFAWLELIVNSEHCKNLKYNNIKFFPDN